MPAEPKSLGRSMLTPFNVFAAAVIAVGLIDTVLRFTRGLGAVSNLSDYHPWGIWIGFDLLVGVALAAGGFVTSAAVYIFGLKKYHSAVRPAILTGFLGCALLFEVAACVALYLTVLFIEYSPAALEGLGLKKARNLVVRLTLVLTIFGVVLSTLHQSSLGALFLIAPYKLHPLW